MAGVCVWYTTGPRDMFNIGFGELAIICIVLIIAVGPERLPSMMKTLGKTIRTLRQASRDIRASTGIDEMMREDFDLYAPIRQPPPRRPAPPPAPAEPAALAADAEASEPSELTTPAAHLNTADTAEPKPVSREESVETADRPSVVVAPPPQAIGLPSDEPTPTPPTPPTPPTAAVAEAESATATQPAAASGTNSNGAAPEPIPSNVDTLPSIPFVQTAPATPISAPEPQPEAAQDRDKDKDGSASSEPKQSGA